MSTNHRTRTMPKYEVGVYNERVREKLAEGEHHRFLSDDWADTHYIEVSASSEQGARSKVLSRHSVHEGYVIVSVEVQED